MKKNERSSNIELLRIICMILIVAHHLCVHGGIFDSNTPFKIPCYFFAPIGKICFITFIAISMWFMVDKEFKAERFVRTWFQVLFYSVAFCIATAFVSSWTLQESIKNIFSSFFPLVGNVHGFAAAYLTFYILFPFISKIAHTLTAKQHRFLLFIIFYIQIFSLMLSKITGYQQPIPSMLLLFLFCYLLMFNLKKYPFNFFDKKSFLLVMLILPYILLGITWIFSMNNPKESLLFLFLSDENSIFYIASGFSLFFLFKEIHIRSNPTINYLASRSFGVLLFHDNNFFRYVIWSQILRTQNWCYSKFFPVIFPCVVSLVYGGGVILDTTYHFFVEKYLIGTKIYLLAVKKINSLIME